VCFQDAMDDRNFVPWDLVYCYIPGVVFLVLRVSEEEQVASVECWFH
jgi:hypothetical protein